MQTPDPTSAQDMILRAGFTPSPVYEKQDPRGPEYGSFRVVCYQKGPVVYAEYLRNGDRVYMLYVPLEHFENWARECT